MHDRAPGHPESGNIGASNPATLNESVTVGTASAAMGW